MNRLKDLREDNDLTQKELANYLHCNQATYSRYENEKSNIPVDILKNLAKFFNVSIDYLTCLSKEKDPFKK